MKTSLQSSFLFLSLFCAYAHASPPTNDFFPCSDRPEQYAKASAELQKLEAEDQADRQGSINEIDWPKVAPRDLDRRIKVAKFFAEGCFRDGKDYAAAAMVYQHGNTADHSFQAFIWAKRATDLGTLGENKWLMAAALDRFLVRSGQKQLFATQYAKDTGSECWCLEPVELSFPENRRVEYGKKSLQQALETTKMFDADPKACTTVQYCKHDLKPSLAGTVPGFW